MVATTGSVVTVTPVGAGTAVVTVTAVDGEESNAPVEQAFTATVVVDYDADADGLIEVRTLAQLDAGGTTLTRRCDTDGRQLTDERRYAPMSALHFIEIRDPHPRNR